jgi:hypothetical protein
MFVVWFKSLDGSVLPYPVLLLLVAWWYRSPVLQVAGKGP